ncbi:MAG: (2Fe-2S)-binding protein [Burkholderiales bacterium]|nr:(2Fe-2S)-binding protein [Burkholderiales bacterium]
MSEMLDVTLIVNGEQRVLEVPLAETLLTSLRDRLGYTSAKRGCNQGVCGACTVHVRDTTVRACLSLTANCEGLPVRTVEGCDDDRIMQALARSFEAGAALQCGFCTPGMLMSAHALLAANPAPSAMDVREALSGNLCRCTGYQKIIAAVLAAARELAR